ncbi:methyl-accepting chemotaxis protein [Rhodoplanes sp. SY1]|uniref:methyl-accepting chemotaxis protein n=1 Tax=Rhodoplanes sp. SY1 TaxID=3166646 RepID=UPI0038B510B1
MRMNFPVTGTEYVLSDETVIVSRTDIKGRLTYFNDQFLAASGFSEEELLGKPHNIVRHPDMPPEAFADLWATLKSGKPWAGAVKNRRKNGDFYWVMASATPVYENGTVTGYMSIRTKLPADQRIEAERVYGLLRDKKAGAYSVTGGVIRTRSIFDRLSLFTGTLKARLITLVAVFSCFVVIGGAGGLVAAGDNEVQVGLLGLSAVLAAALLTGGWLAVRTIQSTLQPLQRLNAALDCIAQGEFNSRIIVDCDDEIGTALRNVQAMQAKLGYERAEQKEIERRTVAQRRADTQRLAAEFENALGEIIDTVSSASTQLEASAHTLAATADRTQSVTISVAAAAEQASANVQSVASASEEMASSVNEIGRQVQDQARIAEGAVQQAETTDTHVAELSQAATRIGDVVKLITAIAEQTNLLALNATIEAARAGEAGKGFAVVAQEVKALAAQTAKATGDISIQITGMQTATQGSVMAIRQIGDTIGRLSEISSSIAAAVEEQGAATREISRNVQQAAQGTVEVSSHVVEVQRGATETGAASTQVLAAARALARDSTRLKAEVHSFLQNVRGG